MKIIAEIAGASKEQSGIGEVNMAVGQMDKLTQTNAANAEETAAAAEEMHSGGCDAGSGRKSGDRGERSQHRAPWWFSAAHKPSGIKSGRGVPRKTPLNLRYFLPIETYQCRARSGTAVARAHLKILDKPQNIGSGP